MTQNTLRFVADVLDSGKKVALIVLTEKSAGAPGAVGQMLAVSEDGTTYGTVGGGASEYSLIERAKKAIANKEESFEFAYDLGTTGMVCGGSIKGYANIFGGGHKLVIFGGGHVAQSLYHVAEPIGMNITVVEDREEFREAFPHANFVHETFAEAAESIPFDKNTFVVIVTRGHSHDYTVLEKCLRRQCGYIGMIGSRTKVSALFQKLRENGFAEEEITSVYAPIGLDIADGTPAEIAISIMAEILAVKNEGTLTHKSKRGESL